MLFQSQRQGVFVVGPKHPTVVHSLSVISVVLEMMLLPNDEDKEVAAWARSQSEVEVPSGGGTDPLQRVEEVGAELSLKLRLEDHFWRC